MEAQTQHLTERPPSPIAGLLAFISRDPLSFLMKVARMGELVPFKVGRATMYLVSSPELVRQVLSADQRHLVKGRTMDEFKAILGEGLISSHGELHDRQRRLLQPLFHRERLHGYAPGMVELADAHQRRWWDGERLELHREMSLLTIAGLGRSLLSNDLEEHAEVVRRVLSNDVMRFSKYMSLPGYPLLRRLPLPAIRELGRAGIVIREVMDRVIEAHEHGADGHDDVLSTLLNPAACGGSPEGIRQVQDEAVTMLMAGHETTATTLTMAWSLLATHPDAAERFHTELDSVLGGRPPTVDDLSRLPYTQAVVIETLRLYPPVWATNRLPTQDFELAGRRIPAGTVLVISPWVIHRHPDLYDEPAAFKPERWIDGTTEKLHRYAFVPFGGGSRKCIGEGFAMTETMLALATIGRRWSIRLEREAIEVEALFTLRPKGRVAATVLRREPGDPIQRSEPPSTPELPEPPPVRGNGTGYWDEVATIWRRGGDQRLWRRHSDAVNRNLLIRWLPHTARSALKTDLWDEAMGEGLYPTMAANETEMTGIDVSAEVVAAARARYRSLDVHCSDVRALPFADQRFDAVVSNSSLDHFASQESILVALRELRRVLKPGGTMLLTLDNPANPIVGLSKTLPRGPLNKVWVKLGRLSRWFGLLPYYIGATYGRRQLKEVLTREGFAVHEMTSIMHFPRPLAVIVAHLLERRADPEKQERFLRWLMSCELLSRSPTRYLTGQFIAVRATKL